MKTYMRFVPFMVGMLLISMAASPIPRQVARQGGDNPNPPEESVKLIFIHHSTGENWLTNDYGNLGQTLGQNNYFVSDTNYGWGPNAIGDRTDIPHWTEWFDSEDTATYMNALFSENGQHSSYTRTLSNPGGENEIIMFKSCFPNSALEGNPNDLPRSDGWLTVGHAKYVYNQILPYFATRPDKLFIVITAPPLIDGTYAANARAFNQWLMNNWLSENNYTLNNVYVFDFYNVLTGPNAHHRYNNGQIDHTLGSQNTLYYPSGGDDHPSAAGSQKATNEFVPMLNIFYHRWKANVPGAATLTSPTGAITTKTPTYAWNQVSDATYYYLWADGPSGNVIKTWYTSAQANCNGSTCSVTPTTALSAGAHTWKIQTYNDSGYGPWSTSMTFTVTLPTPPGKATLSAPTGALSTNTPAYTWNQISSATYYYLWVDGPSGNVFKQWYTSAQANCNGSTCSVTPAKTLSAGAHVWAVQTYNDAGYGLWSTSMSFTTPAPALPGKVTLTSPTGTITTKTPTYTWNQISSATYYYLWVDGPSGNVVRQWYTSAQANCNGSTCSVTPSKTLSKGAYVWAIQTWNDGGYGQWSTSMSFTVAAPGKATLTAPSGTISSHTPTYTWNEVSSATYYYLWVDGPSGNVIKIWYTRAQANCNGSTCSVTPSTTLGSGAHVWSVQTWNDIGYGLWSTSMSFSAP